MTYRTLNLSASDLALMEEIEGEYSDLHKEIHNVRARPAYWHGEAITPETAQRKLDALYASQEREREREAQEREAFRAKVAALGLDPAAYMHLA
jgi:hypothetical protein